MIGVGTAVAQAVAHPKTTRNLMIVAAVIVLVVPVALVAVPVTLVIAIGANGFGGGGGACGASAPSVEAGQNVDGYGPEQLKIAATIITVGQQMSVPPHGQALALMVAIGESGLRNLDHGDAVDNTTIGVFQQGAGYGAPTQRMDPATAAAAFYTRMLHVPDWQTLAPTLVAHAVQINADPNHYAPFWTSAEHVLAALTGASAGTCQVPADARAAAAVLVGAIQAKKLNFLEPRYQQQVINMADGTATPGLRDRPARPPTDRRRRPVLPAGRSQRPEPALHGHDPRRRDRVRALEGQGGRLLRDQPTVPHRCRRPFGPADPRAGPVRPARIIAWSKRLPLPRSRVARCARELHHRIFGYL
ncbi:hypothetical protein [Leifsonia sp. LS-T14]|uniref:hypothetical protein n=1 Tax=unclassified Leifsonia TaxID=2663824 RepID=UPI0035A5E829